MPNVTDAIAGDERLKQTRDRIVEQAADWAALTGRPVDDVLAPAERTATLMALAPDGVSQNTLAGNLRYASRLDAEVVAGIDELNRIRLLLGLGAQAIDPKLCAAATDHSTDMAEKGFFAHESPVPGKASPWDRAKRFGTSASAENIAAGMSTGVAAIHGWWHSPGHFKNMLGGHKRVGLGEHDKHWTQMFG
ncbi:MAG: hypothetical protein GC159_11885 [Phycisphaera sp.]|nr:hypothetical protein [Phycisphaera sp.]